MKLTLHRSYPAIFAVLLTAALLLGACSGIGAQPTPTPEPAAGQVRPPCACGTQPSNDNRGASLRAGSLTD